MTFYQKVNNLCKDKGINVTILTQELGFSSSAGTTWKKSKGLPRNTTLKKIADYFGISVAELEEGIQPPINYDGICTDNFNQPIWLHLLEANGYDEHKAIDAYFAYQKSVDQDALSENSITRSTIQDNHGVIGNAHAPVTIINGSERQLTAQEIALIDLFEKLDVIKQAQLIAYAAELAK